MVEGKGLNAVAGIRDEDIVSQVVRVPRHLQERTRERGAFDMALRRAVEAGKEQERAKVKEAQKKRLMDACIEMESLFVARMLKEMRKTVPKSEWLHGGFAEEIFEDMLYDEYALSLSRNANLGLAKMLFNELQRGM